MVKRRIADSRTETDFIKFLGTAGARFVMIRQLRSSGGVWISSGGTNVLVDPGPGSIVRCAASRPKLDPSRLDAVILTHRHLDHASDINVIIEAMTEGGFKKRGLVFCPQDAVEQDSVILQYAKPFLDRIQILKPLTAYEVGDFRFEVSMPHIHPVETYGIKFTIHGTTVSLLTDTRYFPELAEFYKTDIVVIYVVFLEPRQGVDHLSLQDAEVLIKDIQPKRAVLTHFGMSMLKARPNILAKTLSEKLGIEVIAAYDGMTLQL